MAVSGTWCSLEFGVWSMSMSHHSNAAGTGNSDTGSGGNGGNNGGLYGLSYSLQYAATGALATGAESTTGTNSTNAGTATGIGAPTGNTNTATATSTATATPVSASATAPSSTGAFSDTTSTSPTDRGENPSMVTRAGSTGIDMSEMGTGNQKHINTSSNTSSNTTSNNSHSSRQSSTVTGTGTGITIPVIPTTMLTAKPHAFAGAVLSPKHTLELTPTLCMQISSALADHHKSAVRCVPYTVWITEAWRVLGWAEPSAALFWEMATMYHALAAAGRELAHHAGLMIPPILSCGSTSSLGSGATNSHATDQQHQRSVLDKKKLSSVASAKELPVWLVGTFLLLHCEEFAYLRNISGQDERHERRFYAGKSNTGTCTATATVNTLVTTTGSLSPAASVAMDPTSASATNTDGKLLPILDFPGFFKNPSLSPRTRMHATWSNDNTHCTAFLLRHLRKILLLSAVSNNHDAMMACLHLGSMPPPADPSLVSPLLDFTATNRLRSTTGTNSKKYDANELRRQHTDEHGSVGAQVRLTMEDLERLDFVLQPPHGGGIDEPPLRLGEFLWRCLYHDPPPPTASIPLLEVEREIRQHLELELAVVAGMENPNDDSMGAAADKHSATDGRGVPGREVLSEKEANNGIVRGSGVSDDRAKADAGNPSKERRYNHIQGTTVILKPVAPESPSTASVASGEANFVSGVAMGRLHDVILSDCSDAHFYLLHPFEHATIAACNGCTIVIGAVAGLLHIVDCEKLVITTASRRILVSNSSDVQLCTFTPSPPLLLGDSRSCHFAPYNTFYDGMREDLLATGLAAAVFSDGHQSPYHTNRNDNDASWPLLQCASNKWKNAIEVAKLEVPTVPGSPGGISSPVSLSPGADDRAMGTNSVDVTMLVSALVSPTDFQVLFVPIESDSSRQRKFEAEDADVSAGDESTSCTGGSMASHYCHLLAEVLQLSPFRLPLEYERRALLKAERMRNIQQSVQKNLSLDQQRRFEEELNRGFRDWLVTSGNLRQVLDLVHLEVK